MPPRSDDTPLVSSLRIRPPPNRSSTQSGDKWLQDKNVTDGAEGLWRVHDQLYDLTKFIKNHPGGSEWIELTKGTDITEAFEVHHLTESPAEILKKYYIRDARTKRNSPYTFKEDGFYRTLKKEVRQTLSTVPDHILQLSIKNTAFLTDAMLFFTFVFGIFAARCWSYGLATISGMMLAMVAIAAHNYFHKKDNFRMHYFNFSLMQTRDWRISHVLSHHMHTNTIDDMEITVNEPILHYLPHEKSTFAKYAPWVYFPIYWLLSFHLTYFKRLYYIACGELNCIKWYDVVPYTLPLTMYLLSGESLLNILWMWTYIVLIASLHFSAVGFNAAHHHPDIFHDGDTPRSTEDYDWGLSQLDAIMDRREITGSSFLVLTTFGDHALHHLFPTLDHGALEFLYPNLEKVCKQFNVKLRMTSQIELIKGSFLQLARSERNPNPPNLFKEYD